MAVGKIKARTALRESPLLSHRSHRASERPARSQDLELLGVVVVQECDGYTHRPAVVTWNIRVFGNLDCVVIRVLWVLLARVVLVKNQFLVPLSNVQIRKPTRVPEATPVRAILIAPASHVAHFVMIGDDEGHGVRVAQPN